MALLLGFEGCFSDGAFWNAGSAAIRYDGVHYNAATGHKVSDKEWHSCIERLLVGVCPEPIDLGPLSLEEVTGTHAPFVLAYHFDDDRIHRALERAVEEVPPLRDVIFDARKHKGARWLVFSDYGHYRRFGKAATLSMLDMLGSLPEEELAHWYNPVSLITGLTRVEPEVHDFRRKVGRAFREHVSKKFNLK